MRSTTTSSTPSEASRQRILEGRGTLEDAQAVVTANRQDQRSDYLLGKRNRGEALTAQEDAYLRDALVDYYLGTAALYGDEIARQSVQALLNSAPGQSSIWPLNYTYPFAGSKAQQKEWERNNPDAVKLFRIEQGVGTPLSQAHAKAYALLNQQAHREQLSMMGDGAFLAAGAPGALGKIVTGTMLGTGGAHLAAGAQSLHEGEKLDAAWHFVNATMNFGGAGAGKYFGKNASVHGQTGTITTGNLAKNEKSAAGSSATHYDGSNNWTSQLDNSSVVRNNGYPSKTISSDSKMVLVNENKVNSLNDSTNKMMFADDISLYKNYHKHGKEFNANSANEYLAIAQEIVQKGTKVKYLYGAEERVGYVQFMGNNSKGQAKFAFVRTNNHGNITTLHAKSGKDIWRTLNGDKRHNVIYPENK